MLDMTFLIEYFIQRHLSGVQVCSTLLEGERNEGSQPTHPQQLPALEHEAEVVPEPCCLHHGQVWHVHVCPWHGRGVQKGRPYKFQIWSWLSCF